MFVGSFVLVLGSCSWFIISGPVRATPAVSLLLSRCLPRMVLPSTRISICNSSGLYLLGSVPSLLCGSAAFVVLHRGFRAGCRTGEPGGVFSLHHAPAGSFVIMYHHVGDENRKPTTPSIITPALIVHYGAIAKRRRRLIAVPAAANRAVAFCFSRARRVYIAMAGRFLSLIHRHLRTNFGQRLFSAMDCCSRCTCCTQRRLRMNSDNCQAAFALAATL